MIPHRRTLRASSPCLPVREAASRAAHGAELLVVCRGTWAVLGLDPTSGAPKRLLQLRPGRALPGNLDARIGRMAEPGDILVDEANDRAFVSCTGADSVVQIDLAANQVACVFNQEAYPTCRLKSPLHLSFDFNGVDVLCAPLHSGNNSSARGGLFGSTLVEDLDGAPLELPDEDLFRIKPYVNAGNPGAVEGVLELDMNHPGGPIDTSVPNEITYWVRWRGSFNEWSFPDTKEAQASVRSAPLP